jgi:hypothetical protein
LSQTKKNKSILAVLKTYRKHSGGRRDCERLKAQHI